MLVRVMPPGMPWSACSWSARERAVVARNSSSIVRGWVRIAPTLQRAIQEHDARRPQQAFLDRDLAEAELAEQAEAVREAVRHPRPDPAGAGAAGPADRVLGDVLAKAPLPVRRVHGQPVHHAGPGWKRDADGAHGLAVMQGAVDLEAALEPGADLLGVGSQLLPERVGDLRPMGLPGGVQHLGQLGRMLGRRQRDPGDRSEETQCGLVRYSTAAMLGHSTAAMDVLQHARKL